MHRHQLTALALVVLVAVAGATTPAAAAEDEPFFEGLVADDRSEGYTDDLGLWIAEQTAGFARFWDATFGERANATVYAQNLTATFNTNNETLEAYANERLNASTNYDVFAVYIHDKAGHNVTRYVVANVSNGNWTNTRMLTPSEFNATNRTTDHWVSLDWYQSKHAAAELEGFVEEYAEPNESISKTDAAKLIAKYGAPRSDMWNSTET